MAGVVQVTPEKLANALEAVLAAWALEVPEFAAQQLHNEVKAAIARV